MASKATRRSLVHSVRVERYCVGRYALPDGMYSSNRYALNAHTFLHLLMLTCVCLLFWHKGDVCHFVFFVHQEHGGIAFE